MNVLALDLSLTATGVCTTKGHHTLRTKLAGTDRLAWYETQIRDLIGDDRPNLVIIEELFEMATASARLGMLHGVVRVLLHWHEMPVVLVSPATLKKYATGKGNATKPDMRMALYKRTGLDLADDNQVDACWLYGMALDHYGYPAGFDLPAVQRACMDKIDWPELVEVGR